MKVNIIVSDEFPASLEKRLNLLARISPRVDRGPMGMYFQWVRRFGTQNGAQNRVQNRPQNRVQNGKY